MYLKIILFILLSLTTPLYSSIIYLKGTCCAGKSTLLRHILEAYPHVELVDEDALIYAEWENVLLKKYPTEYAHISQAIAPSNHYHAICARNVLFRKTATLQEQQQALDAIRFIQDEVNKPENLPWLKSIYRLALKRLLLKVNAALADNKIVILDSWCFSVDQIKNLFRGTPITRMLLYCDFDVAYQRLHTRNAEGASSENIRHNRYVLQLMDSFCSLYKMTQESLNAIASIDIDHLNVTFDEIEENLVNNPPSKKLNFTYQELSRAEFQKLRKDFTKPYKTLTSPCYIQAKNTYDLILDNTSLSPAETVNLLDPVLTAIPPSTYFTPISAQNSSIES